MKFKPLRLGTGKLSDIYTYTTSSVKYIKPELLIREHISSVDRQFIEAVDAIISKDRALAKEMEEKENKTKAAAETIRDLAKQNE